MSRLYRRIRGLLRFIGAPLPMMSHKNPQNRRAQVFYAPGLLRLAALLPRRDLRRRGYPLPGVVTHFINSGGSYGERHNGLLIESEGGGGGLLRPRDGHLIYGGGGHGFVNVGRVFLLGEHLAIYPLTGFGGGGVALGATEPDAERPYKPSRDPQRRIERDGGGVMLHFGLGVEWRFGGPKGFVLGLRAGIIVPHRRFSSLPDVPMIYLRLLIGFGQSRDEATEG